MSNHYNQEDDIYSAFLNPKQLHFIDKLADESSHSLQLT